MKIKISLRSNFPLKTSNNPKHLFTFPPFRVPQPPHKSQANQNIPQPTFLRDLSRYVWLKTFSFTHFIISTYLRLFGNVCYKNGRRWETTPPRIIWQKWRKKLKIVASPLSFPLFPQAGNPNDNCWLQFVDSARSKLSFATHWEPLLRRESILPEIH